MVKLYLSNKRTKFSKEKEFEMVIGLFMFTIQYTPVNISILPAPLPSSMVFYVDHPISPT